MEQVDASLKRLDTDYIDLYRIHRFDPGTPVEETMEALHDVVKAGKVRYLGASSMWAWQFATMQHTAHAGGWTRFVSMQDQYSLVHREEEREMFGLLAAHGVGSIPWSPLAAGPVARPWGERATNRAQGSPTTDAKGRPLFLDSDRAIVDTVQRIGEARGVPMAQVAMARVLNNPVVSAPIVGATKPHHLADAAAALDITLTDEEGPFVGRAVRPAHADIFLRVSSRPEPSAVRCHVGRARCQTSPIFAALTCGRRPVAQSVDGWAADLPCGV